MKSFNEFKKVNEATIKGNPGVPSDKLSEIERSEIERIRPPRGNRDIGNQLSKLKKMVDDCKGITKGKESELEALAEKVIRDLYGSILDDVDLDIKFANGGMDVNNFMKDNDCPSCNFGGTPQREIEDEDTKNEIHKRKIINNITQGEAKNVKRVLVMPEVRDEIYEIFGEEDGKFLIDSWKEINDIADAMDWAVPIDIKGDMMENAPQGLAGACSIDWSESEEAEEIDIESLLNDEGSIDLSEEDEEDIEEAFSNGNPIIKAIGVDFPMLLHETIKGIYELIAAAGIPEEERLAQTVIDNTSSFRDEAEEFRYGPALASRLRDCINSCDGVDKHPNMREMVFGHMVNMDAEDFLDLFKRILIEDDSAKEDIENFIDMVIDEMEDYEDELSDYNRDEEEDYYTQSLNDVENSMVDDYIEDEEEDLSTLSLSELRELMDDALDNSDFDRVRKIGEFIKNK